MDKICTSIEQSKKLIELGVDVKTADMYWWTTSLKYYIEAMDDGDFNETEGDVRAWSLSALLSILAKQDFTIKSIGNEFNIDIPIRHCKIWFSSLLDAAFEMVCWLKENNKI